MHYELKKDRAAFEPVTGQFAGRRFEHDVKYSEVPDEFKDRFKKITPKKAEPAPKQTGKEGKE